MKGLYGRPPPGLVETGADRVQFSPTIPGSARLDDAENIEEIIVLAPPGSLERRYVLALALRALKPGGGLTALARKDRGGARLKDELASVGVSCETLSRAHHKVCIATATGDEPVRAWLDDGAPRFDPALGLWTQPGVFSWDRIDPGSALLADRLPPLAGRGADLGCGLGVLAHAVLASPAVTRLDLVEIDRRALDAARRNVNDPRAVFHWADAAGDGLDLANLDFVVMNPPFHAEGREDRTLGQAFIAQAARLLRKGGVLWLVANRHLPYEAELKARFARTAVHADANGFKVIEARK